MNYYKQCELSKGSRKQIVWIPEQFALLHKYLKILDENGWKVNKIFSRQNEEYVLNHMRDYINYGPSLSH